MKIFLKVKCKTSVKSPKGPNCLLCPDVEGGKGGGTIFWEPWFWGANFENAQNVKGGGGSKYYDTGLAFYTKVVKLYYDWSKSTFPSEVDKKIGFSGSLSTTKCYRIKLGPETYQLFLLPGSVHVLTYAYAYSWNLEKIYRIFLFPESIIIIKLG